MEKETNKEEFNYRVRYHNKLSKEVEDFKYFKSYDEAKKYYMENRENSNFYCWAIEQLEDNYNHTQKVWCTIIDLYDEEDLDNYKPFSEDEESNRVLTGKKEPMNENETIDFLINLYCKTIAPKITKFDEETIEDVIEETSFEDNFGNMKIDYNSHTYTISSDFIDIYGDKIMAKLLNGDYEK